MEVSFTIFFFQFQFQNTNSEFLQKQADGNKQDKMHSATCV